MDSARQGISLFSMNYSPAIAQTSLAVVGQTIYALLLDFVSIVTHVKIRLPDTFIIHIV